MSTSPQLMYRGELDSRVQGVLVPRADTKPFSDIRVRRALAMAIDREAILRDYYHGKGQLVGYPAPNIPENKGMVTRLEELPESTRELYEYHPDKAKQLLAEAGYPNGFKFSAVLRQDWIDLAQIYKADLAKVGIDMELDVKEAGVYTSMSSGVVKAYKEATFVALGIKGLWKGTDLVPGSNTNYMQVTDPVINDYRAKITSFENMQNQAELDRLRKELALHIVSQAYFIDPPVSYVYVFYQPWVKNLNGLYAGGYSNYSSFLFYTWIDQELKKQMGY